MTETSGLQVTLQVIGACWVLTWVVEAVYILCGIVWRRLHRKKEELERCEDPRHYWTRRGGGVFVERCPTCQGRTER